MEQSMQACCGCDCTPCEHRINGNCLGCSATAGKPFWAAKIGLEQCPFYTCCILEHSYPHCGRCAELPCKLHTDFRDPSVSEEQCQLWLKERLENLKHRS